MIPVLPEELDIYFDPYYMDEEEVRDLIEEFGFNSAFYLRKK